jgi:hypothetical protein
MILFFYEAEELELRNEVVLKSTLFVLRFCGFEYTKKIYGLFQCLM